MFLLPLLRDELDRKLQSEFMANVLARAVNPVVMAGYLTNKPHSRDYKKIVESGKVKVRRECRLCVFVVFSVCVCRILTQQTGTGGVNTSCTEV